MGEKSSICCRIGIKVVSVTGRFDIFRAGGINVVSGEREGKGWCLGVRRGKQWDLVGVGINIVYT